MTGKRSYDDGSLAAQALETIGERWALLIVRELLFGPRRFRDLQAELRTISPNVLTQRLGEMTASGVLSHRKLSDGAWVYDLTPKGRALEPVLLALGEWAAQSPAPKTIPPVSAAGVLLALRTMTQAVEGARFDLQLNLAGRSFHLRLGKQRLKIEAGAPDKPDAVLTATPDALQRLVFEGRDLKAAVQKAEVEWTGDRAAFQRLIALVPAAAGPRPGWETGAD